MFVPSIGDDSEVDFVIGFDLEDASLHLGFLHFLRFRFRTLLFRHFATFRESKPDFGNFG